MWHSCDRPCYRSPHWTVTVSSQDGVETPRFARGLLVRWPAPFRPGAPGTAFGSHPAKNLVVEGPAMRVSYGWILELVPGLPATPAQVGEALTRIGLELEEVTEFGGGLEAVVIGEVLRVEPHPERDKLQLVSVGLEGDRTQTVVCGASNVPAPGGQVVLAPLGTYLPAIGLKLEPKKLGGIVSEGMLCSETELGLGADANGILTFPAGRFPRGTAFRKAFPTSRDTVFTIGVTPNRPDALGHRGIARDLATAFGLDWTPPPEAPLNPGANASEDSICIENRAPERCPAYAAAVVTNVTVGASPEWMRWRLFSLGIRPISNVVDVTNWVLQEFGNPMHAFDLDRVAGKQLIIRTATPGERITTLDGTARELDANDLVIADQSVPSALAGIMGSKGSEITSATQRVLLECAWFEPRGIRRSSRRLGLSTDSSYRFERGVDWEVIDAVLRRAAALLSELAGGIPAAGIVRKNGVLPAPSVIELRSARLNALLGRQVPFDAALVTLKRLGFVTRTSNAESAEILTRPGRPDVSLEADLIEEIARIDGLDAIPTVLPAIKPEAPSNYGQLERRLRELSAALGLSEAVTYSFVSREALTALKAKVPTVELINPLTEERSVMTTSLLPGLVDVAARARRHGEGNMRLFTIASTFEAPLGAVTAENTAGNRLRDVAEIGVLPLERPGFAAILAGERPSYLTKPEALDVYDAKGLVVELLERLLGHSVDVVGVPGDLKLAHLHPRGRARIRIAERNVGTLGPLHPDVVDHFELSPGTLVIELDLFALEELGRAMQRYRAIPRLPGVARDIALEAPAELPAGQILETIRASAGDLCESVELFDLFRAEGAESARRSLAFRLVYRDPKAATDPDKARTLTDKEVDKQHQRVIDATKQLGVSLKM
jgi:phenylalanyl-tRNA synthetase beta chain